jgi:hypothetical protein
MTEQRPLPDQAKPPIGFVDRVMASIDGTSRPSLIEAIALALGDRSLAGLTGAVATAWRVIRSQRTLPWTLRAQALAIVMVLALTVAGGGVLTATTAYGTVAPAIRSLTQARSDSNEPLPPVAGSGTASFPRDEPIDGPSDIASSQPSDAATTERPGASRRPDDGQSDHQDADRPASKGDDGDGQADGGSGGSVDHSDATPSPTSDGDEAEPSTDAGGSQGGDDGG